MDGVLYNNPEMHAVGYDILAKHVPLVQPYIKHKIDLGKYIYQFSTRGVEPEDR